MTCVAVEERERITEHLARCESCYEIFAGAMHFQEEEEEEEELVAACPLPADPGGVLPFPLAEKKDRAPRRIPRWLLLAASVVLVAGLGFFTWRLLEPPKITLAGVVKPIEKKAGISEVLYDKDVFRSGDEPADLGWDHPAFLVGVHLIDLRLSVNAGKVEAAENHLRDMGNAFNAMPGFGDLGKRCTDEVAVLSNADALERFARELPSLEQEIEQSLSGDPSFSFGLWTEAGRLAAAVKSPELFARRDNRRFLSLVQKNVPVAEEIEDQVLGDLRAVEGIWEKGDFSEDDYQALSTHFQNIIQRIDDYNEDLTGDE